MSNPSNTGTLIGRLGADPKVFNNADGSKTLAIDLGVEEDFLRAGQSEPQTDWIPARVFIPAKAQNLGSWGNVHKGDLIAVNFRLSCKRYERNGETVYPPATVEIDGYPRYLEPKSVTSARRERNAQATQTPAEQPAAAGDEVAELQAKIAALQANQGGDASAAPFGGQQG